MFRWNYGTVTLEFFTMSGRGKLKCKSLFNPFGVEDVYERFIGTVCAGNAPRAFGDRAREVALGDSRTRRVASVRIFHGLIAR